MASVHCAFNEKVDSDIFGIDVSSLSNGLSEYYKTTAS